MQLAAAYAHTRSGRNWAADTALRMARAVLRPDAQGGWTLACPGELEASMYRQGVTLDLWPQQTDVPVPVTLIGADPGRAYPAATALSNQSLAAEGGFDYRAIADTSHLLQLEAPAACAEAALAALRRVGLA